MSQALGFVRILLAFSKTSHAATYFGGIFTYTRLFLWIVYIWHMKLWNMKYMSQAGRNKRVQCVHLVNLKIFITYTLLVLFNVMLTALCESIRYQVKSKQNVR